MGTSTFPILGGNYPCPIANTSLVNTLKNIQVVGWQKLVTMEKQVLTMATLIREDTIPDTQTDQQISITAIMIRPPVHQMVPSMVNK